MDLHGGINSSVITHRPLKLRLFSWDEKYEYETDVLSNVKMLKVSELYVEYVLFFNASSVKSFLRRRITTSQILSTEIHITR